MTRAIVDLTRNFPSTEVECLSLTRDFLAKHGVHPQDIHFLARPEQLVHRTSFPASSWATSDTVSAPAMVDRLLAGFAVDKSAQPVLLLSYSGDVLRLATTTLHGVNAQGLSFKALRPTPMASPNQAQEPHWMWDHIVPLEAALDVMVQVLRQRSATSRDSAARLTDLRPWMAFLDRRLAGKAKPTASAGLMTTLVRIADARGLTVTDWSLVNPAIWLGLSDSKALDLGAQEPERKKHPVTLSFEPASGAAETVRNENAPNEIGTDDAQSDGPSTFEHGEDRVGSSDRASANVEHRSRLMGEVLKSRGHDAFSDARPYLCAAVDKMLLEAGEGIPLQELLSRAQSSAEMAATAAGKKSGQPWGKVVRLVEGQILRHGLALDNDGNPVRKASWSCTPLVRRMAENWSVYIDAEFVHCLAENMHDISRQDLKNLARVLYRSAKPQDEKRAFAAVELLLSEGRVKVADADGVDCLRIVQQSSADSAQILPFTQEL